MIPRENAALRSSTRNKSTTARQPGAASRPAPTSNGPARQLYTGAELAPYRGRPGAMDAFALPSRMGNSLHWRDGRSAPHTTASALPTSTAPAPRHHPRAHSAHPQDERRLDHGQHQ